MASAGPDFYVIALADPSVQHGALGKHSFYNQGHWLYYIIFSYNITDKIILSQPLVDSSQLED